MRNILLGVSGGIAAYKAAELTRLFIKSGYNVKVVMTEGAKQFIHQNTFAALTNNQVYHDTFDPNHPIMMHIDLAKWADLIIIAPASAASISRLASGLCSDLLTTVCIASEAQIFIAPAMNKTMWNSCAVQQNVHQLEKQKVKIIYPASGEQACGDVGFGRMQEPEHILKSVNKSLNYEKKLDGLKVVITAGPTRESLDPVRYISNHSSGKMGYALAIACANAGAEVTLISGPTNIEKPKNINRLINVTTAEEMHKAAVEKSSKADIFISAAAVVDYKPLQKATNKIKKHGDKLTLELIKTPDILTAISKLKDRPICIGFAAETENLIENAKLKLQKKRLDAIIANQICTSGAPFYSDDNKVTWIDNNNQIELNLMPKDEIAEEIVELIHSKILHKNNHQSNIT